MEHFIRIAFWIVTLSACLPAESLPIADSNIGRLNRTVSCPSDSRFYIQSNVADECNIAALDCFKQELDGTVREECEIHPIIYLNQTVEFLERVIDEQTEVARQRNGNVPSNSAKCFCERAPGKPIKEFLNAMKSLLEGINTRPSS